MTNILDNVNYYFSVKTTLVNGKTTSVISKKNGGEIKEYLSKNPNAEWTANPIKGES